MWRRSLSDLTHCLYSPGFASRQWLGGALMCGGWLPGQGTLFGFCVVVRLNADE